MSAKVIKVEKKSYYIIYNSKNYNHYQSDRNFEDNKAFKSFWDENKNKTIIVNQLPKINYFRPKTIDQLL